KVDTGARSSSLHVFHIHPFAKGGEPWIRFDIHPIQRNTSVTVTAEAPLIDYRRIRSSGGHETVRPVVLTVIQLLGKKFPIDLTLANRDSMGFRMLLGRQAVRGKYLIDAGKSFLGGWPDKLPAPKPRKKRRKDDTL